MKPVGPGPSPRYFIKIPTINKRLGTSNMIFDKENFEIPENKAIKFNRYIGINQQHDYDVAFYVDQTAISPGYKSKEEIIKEFHEDEIEFI